MTPDAGSLPCLHGSPVEVRELRTSDTERLLLTPAEAALCLGLGQTKVYELLASGELESIKIGTARRIPRDALDRFIAVCRGRS